MTGFFLINKPTSITSHDVIDCLRKITGEKRIGHAGTLDPAASGLLIVAIGREYTKDIAKFVGLDKEYLATLTLGRVSTSYDAEGEITTLAKFDDRQILPRPSRNQVEDALTAFLGKQLQTPPAFSAKKISGRTAYSLARQGKAVKLEPVPVTIHELELLKYEYPQLQLRTKVSSGTYIRSLAHDLGKKLGLGAYLNSLERTKIGDFLLENAANLDKIKTPQDLEKYKVIW